MAILTNGAEFKRFYNDDSVWTDGIWHEDELITIDGVDREDGEDLNAIPDTAKVRIEGGIICGPQWPSHEGPSFEGHFKAWRKKQTMRTILVECDESKLDALKAAIRAAGGKVL